MRKIDLNGTWDFMADLDPKYHAIHGGFQNPDLNRRHWQKVPVPGVWQKYAERYDIFEGVCWLAREFEVDEFSEGTSAFLRFGAVNYLCNVYVNGQLIGGHEGGYTAFSLDCSKVLKPGKNQIAVQVDNRSLITKWPPCLGYFNYGGIHRDVTLEINDGPVLETLRLQAVPTSDGGDLTVSGRVAGMRSGIIVRISNENGLSWEERVGADGAIDCEVPFPGVTAWTPDHPHLEPVVVELLNEARQVIDLHKFQCGFRTLGMRDGNILLNNEPLTLKGICYVYDSPDTGLVMTQEQINTDIRLMKEMGCNAVRCHYPMDEKFYSACNQAGILVWIEPPVYCYHPKDDASDTMFSDIEWNTLAEKMITEMIQTARNHPSVAIYGIGNECNTNNPEADAFFRSLAARVRSEDPTRLVSYAALYGIVGSIADIVDIIGINSYWGWYDKIWGGKGLSPEAEARLKQGIIEREPIDLARMREMLDKVLDGKRNLALLLTEFGADSVPGFYSKSRDFWSEDYHADLLTEILSLAKEYPQIAGTFPFCFSDYRDPSKTPNGYWNELNLKGTVDYHRNRKLAFYSLQTAYCKAKL